MIISSIIQEFTGYIPIQYGEHVEIIKLLINTYNVPIDETDRRGKTAFILACQKGHDDVVHEFIHQNIDINRQDDKGSTPLIWAVEGGRPSTVRLLLGAGANSTLRSQAHGTALELTKQKIEIWSSRTTSI